MGKKIGERVQVRSGRYEHIGKMGTVVGINSEPEQMVCVCLDPPEERSIVLRARDLRSLRHE